METRLVFVHGVEYYLRGEEIERVRLTDLSCLQMLGAGLWTGGQVEGEHIYMSEGKQISWMISIFKTETCCLHSSGIKLM